MWRSWRWGVDRRCASLAPTTRDYIHVMDLAEGHVAALERLLRAPGSFTVNLGTGRGYSVLELLAAYSRACGRELPYEVVARRDGDVAELYADVQRAHELLGWRAKRDLDAMCRDSWSWQSSNPRGFDDEALRTKPGALSPT
jgi:UDP-glucose 4-epimerase